MHSYQWTMTPGIVIICLTKTRRIPNFLARSSRSSPRHHHQSHEGKIALKSLGDRRCIKAYPSPDPTPSTGGVGWANQRLPDVTSMALSGSFRSGTMLISLRHTLIVDFLIPRASRAGWVPKPTQCYHHGETNSPWYLVYIVWKVDI